ncbi:hypothetical protein ACIO87_36455 [Streptomyces sp. NPDC087218]|uniref:hypothetical protein n=1 Tax=Streptomyces sp. NPDC087218 TaxID=3365769 RepID=UPI0038307931
MVDRAGFRVQRVQRIRGVGIYELTRFTGQPRRTRYLAVRARALPRHPHIIWRRIGTHTILTAP